MSDRTARPPAFADQSSRRVEIWSERLLPLTPIVVVLAVIWAASVCATALTRAAARGVARGAEDAAGLVELLPEAEDVPCPSCELSPSPKRDVPWQFVETTAPAKPGESVVTPSLSIEETAIGAEPLKSISHKAETFPTNAPRCAGISSYIITVFDSAKHSVATLSTDPRDQGTRRREGQMFGEYRVAKIGFNRRKMSSAVWLEHAGELCQVLLRDDHPKRERLKRAALRRQVRKDTRKRKRHKARRKPRSR